jgi:hypothetical protein
LQRSASIEWKASESSYMQLKRLEEKKVMNMIVVGKKMKK